MIGFVSVERSYPVLGSLLCGVAWDGHHLWYADAGTARLSCLDGDPGTIRQEVVCLEMRTGLTFDGTSLWQMAGHPKRIRVIDPTDGHIVREVVLGEQTEGMAGLYVDGTSYWLGPEQEGSIEQHALRDNKERARNKNNRFFLKTRMWARSQLRPTGAGASLWSGWRASSSR